MKKIVRDSKHADGGPELIEMNAIDADHAVAADPERYSIEASRPVLMPPTLEQRVDRIERRLGPETPEEIEHRKRPDQGLADRAAEPTGADGPAYPPAAPAQEIIE